MRAVEFLAELQLQKNQWEVVVSDADKQELSGELIDLVRNAYAKTKLGSLVNSLRDVIPSDWVVLDWDNDPGVDATVFYRKNRPGENWIGYKIQGLGHDGGRVSKDKAIHKIQELLHKDGWWVESSDAMRSVLKRLNMPAITNEQFLRVLLNDPNLTMIEADTYKRQLQSGLSIVETVFGRPKLKGSI